MFLTLVSEFTTILDPRATFSLYSTFFGPSQSWSVFTPYSYQHGRSRAEPLGRSRLTQAKVHDKNRNTESGCVLVFLSRHFAAMLTE